MKTEGYLQKIYTHCMRLRDTEDIILALGACFCTAIPLLLLLLLLLLMEGHSQSVSQFTRLCRELKSRVEKTQELENIKMRAISDLKGKEGETVRQVVV